LLALATSLDSVPVDVTLDGLAGVLQALEAAWERARRRGAEQFPDQWTFWSLVSGGLALGTNTSPLFPGGP
jgi:hypothetical protein